MIKLIDILENKILVPRRSKEERAKNYQIVLQKQVQQYMKNGGEGDLNLRNTPITSLPSGLTVGGDLNLFGAPITSLPSGLSVGGHLSLTGTPIKSLPPSLSVGGNLYLGNTPITSLPPGLKVGRNLDLYSTPIISLPSDLNVGGFLDLRNTPLSKSHTEEQIKQMAPGIKGNIYNHDQTPRHT
jgi:hypothetical protein